jgi:hypothetical protein
VSRRSPNVQIVDAAHNGGNAHFFFLPPLVPAPSTSGTPDGSLSPEVVICEWSGSACTTTIARFTMQSGTGAQIVRYDASTGQYIVNWDTKTCITGSCTLDPAKTYRLRVRVAAVLLGFADVDVVSSGSELRNVQTGEYIGLVNGRTLPVKFRIERGAVSVLAVGGSAPVGTAGGNVTTTDGSVGLAIPEGALASSTSITAATVAPPAEGTGPWAPVVQLGPDGTTFAQPVTLTLAYAPENLPEGVPDSALGVFTFDGTGWDEVPGSVVNQTDHTVSAPINHFSFYAVIVRPNILSTGASAPTTLTVGQTTQIFGAVRYYNSRTGMYQDVNNVAVYWYSTAPQVASVPVGPQYTRNGDVVSPPIIARAPGVAAIYAVSVGVTSSSVTLTVLPSLKLFIDARVDPGLTPRQVGIGQEFLLTPVLPNPAGTNLALVVSHSNAAVAAITTTASIAQGQNFVDLKVRGRSAGRDTIVAAAPGFGPDTVIVDVGPGQILVRGFPGTLQIGDSAALSIVSQNPSNTQSDNAFGMTFALGGGLNLRFSDGHRVITSIAIPDGTSSTGTFYMVATGPGNAAVRITSPNYVDFNGAFPVAGQQLVWQPRALTIVAGWTMQTRFAVATPMATDVVVSLTNVNAFLGVFEGGTTNFTAGGETGQYTLPAGSTSKAVSISGGNGPGVDTLIVSGPGLIADTTIITLVQGTLRLDGWPTLLQVGDSAALQVTVADQDGNPGNLGQTITLALGSTSGLVFTDGSGAITTQDVRLRTSATFYAKAVAAGAQSITITHRDYITYTNTVTTEGQPIINPFPQAGQQFVLPVLAGTPGTGVAPISNAGTGSLGGLQVVGAPYICTSGQQLPWLAFAFDSPTAPTNLRVTASVPAGTALGIYDFCFTLRGTGAPDRPYGVRVSVQQVLVDNPPIIDPFPQGRTQHSITVPAGGIGIKDVPVGNIGGSPLTGLTFVGPVTNCANGQAVSWLSYRWAGTTAPTTLTLTATPPGSTASGTYELCFQIQARLAGAMDKFYGINVVVQPALSGGAQSVCGHNIAGIGYDGTYYYVGEAHDGLLQCLSRWNAATGMLADTRQIFLDHRGVHWVPSLGLLTSRTWGGPISTVDFATGAMNQIATNPTNGRPGDEQSQPAVDPDGQSYWILNAGQAERHRLSDHALLKMFPVATTATTNTIAVSNDWVFVLEGAFANAYSKTSAALAGRQPLPFAHGCNYFGFGVSATADRIMYLRDCRHVEVVPVTVTFAEPIVIPTGPHAEVASGGKSTCEKQLDGTVFCWGEASYGATANSAGAFTTIGGGGFHYCGIRPDGTLNCWGYNSDNRATPPGGSFRQLAVGAEHNCALRTDDTAACWGFLNDGRGSPPAGTYKQITVGWYHGCAIRPDDSVVCWGRSDHGANVSPTGTYRAIEGLAFNTCGIRTDYTLACWGDPSLPAPPSGAFVALGHSVGGHMCAIRSDGSLACWGQNDFGQANPPAGQFIQVSEGGWHSCGVRTDGTVACWGSNATGATDIAACVPTPSSLTHWWTGDNGAQDIIGADDGTTVGSVTYANGVVGQAFQFGSGYLRLSQNYGGPSTSEVTVMAWIQTQQSGPSAWQAILSSTTSSFLHFQTSTFGGAAVYTDPGSAQFTEIPSFGPTPLNVWRHVAMTVKSGDMRIYENGSLISQASTPFTYVTQQDDAVLIGAGYGNGRAFPGLVDELQVYSRALSASEVQQIFAAGSLGVCRP